MKPERPPRSWPAAQTGNKAGSRPIRCSAVAFAELPGSFAPSVRPVCRRGLTRSLRQSSFCCHIFLLSPPAALIFFSLFFSHPQPSPSSHPRTSHFPITTPL
ncbi:hypothetical protein BDW71DRAFT_160708 [Aspergillus fruticulosus]